MRSSVLFLGGMVWLASWGMSFGAEGPQPAGSPPGLVPIPRVQAPFPGIDEVLLSVDSGRAESRSHCRSIAGVIKTLYRLIGQWMLTGRIGRVVIRSETFSFGCSSGPWRISSPLGGSFNGGNRYGLMYCVMVG